MSSAPATRRRVEGPKTKSAKVFDRLLISDRAASSDQKITYNRHFKLSVHFFLKMRGCNFSSRKIAAHLVKSK